MHGETLRNALEQTDLYVGTSAIEGYPLTLVEAQSLGLPLAIYELPWLATLKGNRGVLTAPQYDARGLAQEIAALRADPGRYEEMSRASLEAARSVLAHDFTELYSRLVEDSVPNDDHTEVAIPDAEILIDRAVAFAEQNIRFARRTEDRLRNQVRDLREKNSTLDELNRKARDQLRDLTESLEASSMANAKISEDLAAMAEKARIRKARNAGLSRLGRLKDERIRELEAELESYRDSLE